MFLGRITNDLKTKRRLGKLRLGKIYFSQLPQAHPGVAGPGSAFRIRSRIIEAGYLLSPGGFQKNFRRLQPKIHKNW